MTGSNRRHLRRNYSAGGNGARPFKARLALPFAVTALPGCTGIQSVLDPRGPAASTIADLSWAMFAGAGLIFLLVMGLLAYSLLAGGSRREGLNVNRFIFSGGVVLPIVTLSILLFFVFQIAGKITKEPEDPLIVEITGHQWWWEIRYIGDESQQDVTTANELHLPVGRPVKLRLRTEDVIHSFWIPSLAGKRDMVPGMDNTLVLEADTTGLFRGICNEFCGAQHALMRIFAVSMPAAAFEEWLATQRRPAQEPADDLLQRGRTVFNETGCIACHTIRGTAARGVTGPDLTHVGSRRTLAAGVLRNTRANLAAWIVSSQHIKPGNKMPDYPMEGERLLALAAYLESLK